MAAISVPSPASLTEIGSGSISATGIWDTPATVSTIRPAVPRASSRTRMRVWSSIWGGRPSRPERSTIGITRPRRLIMPCTSPLADGTAVGRV